MKNDSQQYRFQVQANSSGQLTLSLASLYDCLPKCDRYGLDGKQADSAFPRILQVAYFLA